LSVQDRLLRTLDLDREGDKRKERREQYEGDRRNDHVENPLDQRV
jgi:hypothetical protein